MVFVLDERTRNITFISYVSNIAERNIAVKNVLLSTFGKMFTKVYTAHSSRFLSRVSCMSRSFRKAETTVEENNRQKPFSFVFNKSV